MHRHKMVKKYRLYDITQDKNIRNFLLFPEKIYQGNKCWVEPIIKEQEKFFSEKNPLWKHAEKKLFLVYDGREIVARGAAIINKNKQTNKKTQSRHKKTEPKEGYFGFFETKNEISAVRLLFSEIERFMRKKGVTKILGPVNGTISFETGVLIDSFNTSPMPTMPYNPKYYVTLLKKIGFKKSKDLYAYSIDVDRFKIDKKAKKMSSVRTHKEIAIRSFTSIAKDGKKLNNLINTSMGKTHHWEFHPASYNEFKFIAKDLLRVSDKKISLIAEYKKDIVGALIIIPNFNEVIKKFHGKLGLIKKIMFLLCRHKIKTAKIEIICVNPKYLHKHIGLMLMNHALEVLHSKGYKRLEYSWVSEDNKASQGMAKHFKGHSYKKYRVFEKKITKKSTESVL